MAGLVTGLGACGQDDASDGTDSSGGGDEVGDGDGDAGTGDICQECSDQNKDAYTCYDLVVADQVPLEGPDGTYQVCGANEAAAISACQSAATSDSIVYNDVSVQFTPCFDSTASCTGWSPASSITRNSGVYEVDTDFIDDLILDPAPLSACDDARLVLDGGNYKLASISSGDTAYQLGFQTDDVITSVNGVDIEGFDDAAGIFLDLLNGETEFEITLERGANRVTMDYEIVP